MWLARARKRKLVQERLQDGPGGSAVRAGRELVKDEVLLSQREGVVGVKSLGS